MKWKRIKKKIADPRLTITLVFAVAAGLRLLLLAIRWINPDEGAHLMGARLFLDGFWPVADFGSRQPFYIFVLTLAMQIFGVSLWAGRLVPLVSSLITGWLLYLIARRLVNRDAGIFAAASYWLLPILAVWSVVVKTEPLAMCMVTLSVLLMLNAFELPLQRRGWVLVSGICAALAFYVRQSTLYLPLTALIYFLWIRRDSIQLKFLHVLYYVLGFLSVILALSAVYSTRMGWQQVVTSQLNPLNIVANRLLHSLGMLPPELRVVEGTGFRILDQEVSVSLEAWRHSIFYTFFLVTSAIACIGRCLRKATTAPEHRQAMLLFLTWLCTVMALYAFQTAHRGFYTQYYTEALPPMVLLAAGVMDSQQIKQRYRAIFLPLMWGLFYGIYLLHRIFWHAQVPIPVYWLSACVLTFFLGFLFQPLDSVRGKQVLPIAGLVSLIAMLLLQLVGLPLVLVAATAAWLFFLVFKKSLSGISGIVPAATSNRAWLATAFVCFFFTAAYSGKHLGPQYEGVWSQSTLRNAAAVLRHNGSPADEVLSGGMIWTLESGLLPFQNVAHPTEFVKRYHSDFISDFQQNRPRFIVLDGYTRRKYQKHWSFIESELETHYLPIAKIPDARFPVIIYSLRDYPLELSVPKVTFRTNSPAETIFGCL